MDIISEIPTRRITGMGVTQLLALPHITPTKMPFYWYGRNAIPTSIFTTLPIQSWMFPYQICQPGRVVPQTVCQTDGEPPI